MTNDPGVRGETSRMNRSKAHGPKVVIRLNIKRLNEYCEILPSDNHHHRQRYVLPFVSVIVSCVTEFVVYVRRGLNHETSGNRRSL